MGTGYADGGLRVITYDLPGYGLSDAAPGRIVADTAADSLSSPTASDSLVSRSWACRRAASTRWLWRSAGLPDRVNRCVCVKALAPYWAEDLDFFAGMDLGSASAFRAVAQGDRAALTADAEGAFACVKSDFPGLDAPGPVAAMLKEAFREAFRHGLVGHMDDLAAHVGDHGCQVESVTVPTLLLAARGDEQVPPGHARWLAARLPDARLAWLEGGHLDDHEQEEIAALVWAGRRTVLE